MYHQLNKQVHYIYITLHYITTNNNVQRGPNHSEVISSSAMMIPSLLTVNSIPTTLSSPEQIPKSFIASPTINCFDKTICPFDLSLCPSGLLFIVKCPTLCIALSTSSATSIS